MHAFIPYGEVARSHLSIEHSYGILAGIFVEGLWQIPTRCRRCRHEATIMDTNPKAVRRLGDALPSLLAYPTSLLTAKSTANHCRPLSSLCQANEWATLVRGRIMSLHDYLHQMVS